MPIGDKKEKSLFNTYCFGVTTNRDIWAYATSNDKLEEKIKNLILFSLYTTNFTEPLSYQDSAFLKLPKFP